MWNGKPLVEDAKDGGAQIAYLPAKMARDLAGGPERLLFMGLWQELAVFAVDLDTPRRPGRRSARGPGPVRGPARRSP